MYTNTIYLVMPQIKLMKDARHTYVITKEDYTETTILLGNTRYNNRLRFVRVRPLLSCMHNFLGVRGVRSQN